MGSLTGAGRIEAGTPRSETAPPRKVWGIRHILVCLDGSPFAEVCLPYAIALSKTFESAITLVHVMETPDEPAASHTLNAVDWEISRQESRAYLERIQKAASQESGQRVDTRVEQGHPAERIVALTREINADLTVLGSHGKAGPTAWGLGSTLQQVLALGHASVLVARPSASRPPSRLSPKQILVPLDGSLRTESVLPIAVRIAKANGGELLLVHVVAEPIPTMLHEARDLELAKEVASRLEAGAIKYLENLRVQLGGDGVVVRTLVVRHANERQSLLEILQHEATDLVVLSAHGSTCSPARPFGNVAAHLLGHSRVPVLALQDLPMSDCTHEAADEELAPPLRASFPLGAV